MKGGKDFPEKRECFASVSNIIPTKMHLAKCWECPSLTEWCSFDEVIYNAKQSPISSVQSLSRV